MPITHQHWTITITAVTEPVLLARITVLLRKYDIAIHQLQRHYEAHGQEVLNLHVQNQRDNMGVAMKKLERLVPIITLVYQAQ